MCVVMFTLIPSLVQIAQYTFLPIGSHFVKRLVENPVGVLTEREFVFLKHYNLIPRCNYILFYRC